MFSRCYSGFRSNEKSVLNFRPISIGFLSLPILIRAKTAVMSLRSIPLLNSAVRRGDGELNGEELKIVSGLIARSEAQQAGIISSDFNLNNRLDGLKATGTREPIWNSKKKISLVTVKQQDKTKGKLQTGQVAVFGIQFRNLGSVK